MPSEAEIARYGGPWLWPTRMPQIGCDAPMQIAVQVDADVESLTGVGFWRKTDLVRTRSLSRSVHSHTTISSRNHRIIHFTVHSIVRVRIHSTRANKTSKRKNKQNKWSTNFDKRPHAASHGALLPPQKIPPFPPRFWAPPNTRLAVHTRVNIPNGS